MAQKRHKAKRELKDYVWHRLETELDSELYYHAIEHTRDVYAVCEQYVDIYRLSKSKADLLLLAAVAHDHGFTVTYTNHEQIGADMIADLMPEYGYSKKSIDTVKGMIMATKIPQTPTNILEQILADADLDYLGRNDYDKISQKLFDELNAKGILSDPLKWLDLQISFLAAHKYHTDFAIKNRRPKKLKRLAKLRKQKADFIKTAESLI